MRSGPNFCTIGQRLQATTSLHQRGAIRHATGQQLPVSDQSAKKMLARGSWHRSPTLCLLWTLICRLNCCNSDENGLFCANISDPSLASPSSDDCQKGEAGRVSAPSRSKKAFKLGSPSRGVFAAPISASHQALLSSATASPFGQNAGILCCSILRSRKADLLEWR